MRRTACLVSLAMSLSLSLAVAGAHAQATDGDADGEAPAPQGWDGRMPVQRQQPASDAAGYPPPYFDFTTGERYAPYRCSWNLAPHGAATLRPYTGYFSGGTFGSTERCRGSSGPPPLAPRPYLAPLPSY